MILNQKILSLEAARGIATILVLLVHASQGISFFTQQEMLKNFFAFGNRAVDFFFVLSGFIIFFVHYEDINQPRQIKRYIWKRFARIYPTYWIACALALMFYFLQGRVNNEEFHFQNIWPSFLLFPFEVKRLIWVSWTLTFEVIFYSLFGILILNKRIGKTVFILWVLAIFASHFLGIQFPFPLDPLLASRNLEFFFGMIAALCLMRMPITFPFSTACIGFCLFIGFAIGVGNSGEVYSPSQPIHLENLIGPLIYGSGGCLFIIGMVAHELRRKMTVAPILVFLGTASYSIYLIHVPALLLFFKIMPLFPPSTIFSGAPFLMLSSSFFAIFAGSLFYWLVEKPVRDLLSRRKYALSKS